jgi:hypothetical protein
VPYPLDETFATGIPAGFAQVGGNGAGFSATHNAAQEAADLVFASNQSFWQILQAEFAIDFWFELDVELVAKTISQWHFGFWLYSNQGTNNTGNYEGHRVAYNAYSGSNHSWQRCSWTNGGSEYNNLHSAEFFDNWVAAGAGQRRTIRLDARRTGVGGNNWWVLRVSHSCQVVAYEYRRDFGALRPAIFGYGCTLRIHSVKGALDSVITETELPKAIANTGGPDHLHIRKQERVETTVRARRHDQVLPRVHQFLSGNGKVEGTVKQKGSPTNIPVWRRVVLIDEKSQTLFRETWSDRTTGAYCFDQVALGRNYAVLSYDHTGAFRAVVADSVQAVPR